MPKILTSRRSPKTFGPYRGGRPRHVERPLHIRRPCGVQPALGPAAAPSDPIQELRHAVDLVVVTCAREAEQLALERWQPVGFPGKEDHAALDLGGLDREPRRL